MGPCGGPIFGPEMLGLYRKLLLRARNPLPASGPVFGSVALGQATAYFQWLNFAIGEAPPGREPLILNMDETSICRHVGGLRGTIAQVSSGRPMPKDSASLAQRRCNISYIACIAHDAAVQPQLPQVLLGNEHQFTKELLRSLVGKVPPNVSIWRQRSAWNSHATMRRWLSLLSTALGPLMQNRYVVLLLDVHASHIDSSIFLHARRCGVRLVYIPAKMTALLQPCDTHVFAMFKMAFRKAWREKKARAVSGNASTGQWLQAVFAAIQSTMARTTVQKAFLSDGVLENQAQMSENLRSQLDLPQTLSPVPPSAEAAACIFPARAKVDVLSYVLWQPKCRRAQSTRHAASSSSAGAQPTVARRVLPASFQFGKKRQLIRTLD